MSAIDYLRMVWDRDGMWPVIGVPFALLFSALGVWGPFASKHVPPSFGEDGERFRRARFLVFFLIFALHFSLSIPLLNMARDALHAMGMTPSLTFFVAGLPVLLGVFGLAFLIGPRLPRVGGLFSDYRRAYKLGEL